MPIHEIIAAPPLFFTIVAELSLAAPRTRLSDDMRAAEDADSLAPAHLKNVFPLNSMAGEPVAREWCSIDACELEAESVEWKRKSSPECGPVTGFIGGLVLGLATGHFEVDETSDSRTRFSSLGQEYESLAGGNGLAKAALTEGFALVRDPGRLAGRRLPREYASARHVERIASRLPQEHPAEIAVLRRAFPVPDTEKGGSAGPDEGIATCE